MCSSGAIIHHGIVRTVTKASGARALSRGAGMPARCPGATYRPSLQVRRPDFMARNLLKRTADDRFARPDARRPFGAGRHGCVFRGPGLDRPSHDDERTGARLVALLRRFEPSAKKSAHYIGMIAFRLPVPVLATCLRTHIPSRRSAGRMARTALINTGYVLPDPLIVAAR